MKRGTTSRAGVCCNAGWITSVRVGFFFFPFFSRSSKNEISPTSLESNKTDWKGTGSADRKNEKEERESSLFFPNCLSVVVLYVCSLSLLRAITAVAADSLNNRVKRARGPREKREINWVKADGSVIIFVLFPPPPTFCNRVLHSVIILYRPNSFVYVSLHGQTLHRRGRKRNKVAYVFYLCVSSSSSFMILCSGGIRKLTRTWEESMCCHWEGREAGSCWVTYRLLWSFFLLLSRAVYRVYPSPRNRLPCHWLSTVGYTHTHTHLSLYLKPLSWNHKVASDSGLPTMGILSVCDSHSFLFFGFSFFISKRGFQQDYIYMYTHTGTPPYR